MEKQEKSRSAIVTGGAGGLEFPIAERLAAKGHKVAIWDINRDRVEASAAKLSGSGNRGFVAHRATATGMIWPGRRVGLPLAVVAGVVDAGLNLRCRLQPITSPSETVKVAVPVNMVSLHMQGGCLCEPSRIVREEHHRPFRPSRERGDLPEPPGPEADSDEFQVFTANSQARSGVLEHRDTAPRQGRRHIHRVVVVA